MDTEQAPLTTDDYQQLHGMLLSSDATVRAQGLGLAHKLTPNEQQAFFDVQKTANAGKGEATRVDDTSPEILGAVGAGAGIARAVAAPAVSVGARVAAGAKAALGQAAPLVKYELTKSALEHLGVPGPAAMAAAIMVSGYKTGPKAAAAEGEGAVSAPGYPRTGTTPAPAPPPAPPPPAPPAPLSDLELVRREVAAGRVHPNALSALERAAATKGAPAVAPPAAPVTTADTLRAESRAHYDAAQPATPTKPTNTLPDQKALNEAALARARAAFAAKKAAAAAAIELTPEEVTVGEALLKTNPTLTLADVKAQILALREQLAGSASFQGMPTAAEARAAIAAKKYKS